MFRPASRIFTPTLFNTTSRRAFSSTQRAQDVARLTLCGRLAADPETVVPANGNSFLRYSVATGFGRGEARRTTYWKVAVFDERQKELVGLIGKGTMVFVEADIETKAIEGEDGKKQNFINLFQRNINILSRPRPQENPDGSEAAEAPHEG